MHGESLSTVVQAHITRKSRINVIEEPEIYKDTSNNIEGLYR